MFDSDQQALAQRHLTGAQSGDKSAFDALQMLLEPAIRRFVRRLIGVHDTEDDIIQDVFTALYVNLARMHPREKLLPFVYRVGRNRCYDALRKQKRHRQISWDDVPSPTAAKYLQPEERAHWSLVYQKVQNAMNTLPEDQRQALILNAEEGFMLEEIAQVMGVPEGTVKSRLYHARRTLRRILSVELYEINNQKTRRKLRDYIGIGDINDD